VLASLLVAIAVSALTGCAGNRIAEDKPASVQTAAAQPDDDATCRAKGYQPGSAEYVKCRKELDNAFVRAQSPSSPDVGRDNVTRALLGQPPPGFGNTLRPGQ
jgi:hypothetical protein